MRLLEICVKREKCECKDATSLYMNNDARLSLCLCGHFIFFSFCIKEYDVNNWAKLCVC